MATWWVRPDSSHSSTRDGTSYETAWGGWPEIVWGASGVRGSTADTLMVCGPHYYNSIASVGSHGATNESQRVTISGEYAPDPGRLTFGIGSYYLQNIRPWTDVVGLDITAGDRNCIFVTGPATNSRYMRNTLRANGRAAFSFYAIDGQNHSDVVVANNVFTGTTTSAGSGTGAVEWFVTNAAATSTMTRLTVEGNTFIDLDTGRAAVHLRTESDTNVASVMSDIKINGNRFIRVRGKPIEATHGHGVFGQGAGVQVLYNYMEDIDEDAAGSQVGGNTLSGFVASAGLGRPVFAYNVIRGIVGPAGGCNIFHGVYDVHHNDIEDVGTTTIDGNGVLFDHGCDDSTCYANKIKNCPGLPGVNNSGCGVMILDSTNVRIWSNLIDTVKHGVYWGARTHPDTGNVPNQSTTVELNTILRAAETGFRLLSTADPSTNIARFNVLTGAGESVRSQMAWLGESGNYYFGMAAANGHTLDASSSTANPQLADSGEPLPGSPVLTARSDGVRRRDIRGHLSRKHIGAYGAARLKV